MQCNNAWKMRLVTRTTKHHIINPPFFALFPLAFMVHIPSEFTHSPAHPFFSLSSTSIPLSISPILFVIYNISPAATPLYLPIICWTHPVQKQANIFCYSAGTASCLLHSCTRHPGGWACMGGKKAGQKDKRQQTCMWQMCGTVTVKAITQRHDRRRRKRPVTLLSSSCLFSQTRLNRSACFVEVSWAQRLQVIPTLWANDKYPRVALNIFFFIGQEQNPVINYTNVRGRDFFN